MARQTALGCFAALALATAGFAQQTGGPAWTWDARFEMRANVRDSEQARFQLRFPFPPEAFPPGQTAVFEETVDAGTHAEVSLLSVTLDAGYGDWLEMRAKVDAIDLYDRNPTSEDRKVDLDELWIRLGERYEGLTLPEKTSFFLQMGKAPKIERQPVRLLESYGITSTAFNRFEDVQFLLGGSAGRNLYWRFQVSNGNPVFFRDSNALAGDNGIAELRTLNPDPELKSGFPILYDAEVEDYFFENDFQETGGGLGYRWARDDGSLGFDILLFHYERELAPEVDLNGTFYGGDLDLLDGTRGISLALDGNDREESGGRIYGEWGSFTLVGQYVTQTLAGLDRDGVELEVGYAFPLQIGKLGSGPLLSSIQPAARYSKLENHFRGPREFVAPSVWWDWTKVDAGIRVGLGSMLDVTLEHAFHDIHIPVQLDVDETLVTFRLRL